MGIDMIDIPLADKVRDSISPGDEVEFITGPDKKLFLFKVLEIKPYSFIVTSSHLGGAVQKLELPISKTVHYITEIEAMRMKAPPEGAATPATSAPAKPRGRPPANPPATTLPAPVGWQGPTLAAGVNAALAAQQPEAEPDYNDPQWIETALNDACLDFADQIKTIMQGIIAVAQNATAEAEAILETSPENTAPFTCFDCMFCNIGENKCDKFNMTPPMHVIADAATKCPDFWRNMPGGMDDEIPF